MKDSETLNPGSALEIDVTRAPISPFNVAITKLVGPESRNIGVPDPTESTPGRFAEKSTESALVNPQTSKVSAPFA